MQASTGCIGQAAHLSSSGLTGRSSIPETSVIYGEAAAYWVPRLRGGRRGGRNDALRLPLHVLDVGEGDPLGPFAGIAEVKLVLGHEHRIAVDVIGDAGAVGGDEGLQLLAVVGRDPARQLEFRN